MALTKQTMTDEQRKSVAIEYLKAFDNGGVTSDGGSILDLFAEDAQVYFPKWGLANGKEQIGQMFGDVGGTLKSIVHHYSHFNLIFSGSDFVVCEGTSHGEHKDGPWRAGVPEWRPAAGATCSRSATGRSIAASSTSIPTMPGRTPPATPGSRSSERNRAGRRSPVADRRQRRRCARAPPGPQRRTRHRLHCPPMPRPGDRGDRAYGFGTGTERNSQTGKTAAAVTGRTTQCERS